MTQPMTRRLGRTERFVTTLGLGGQASLQWTAEGIDPVAIIEKAYNAGINYMDTSNVYGPSQRNYGHAFRRIGVSPAAGNYNERARADLFVAGKTHIRTARCPAGERFPTDWSDGMSDGFGVATAVDDVRRALSLMFGDGQGGYPEGAYLDCIQFHNINTMAEIDMLFEGVDDPDPNRPWMGALAAMLDLREGTDRTGCNPEKERLVRHIGISGHWNTAALMYAIQRDERRVIDTLLVTVNPSDGKYMAHRHNAIATAAAADMGIVGMKVFADAAYYHKAPVFSSTIDDVYHQVGSAELPSADLIRYALSVDGVSTLIIGIGRIDDDPAKCQLSANLAAAQLKSPLGAEQMAAIEARVTAAGKDGANAYFQRPAVGLTPPRHVGAEADASMPAFGRKAVRVSWDSAYAGDTAIDHYVVLRDNQEVTRITHRPQISRQRFCYDDVLKGEPATVPHDYVVRVVDEDGRTADSPSVRTAA
ncbi:aldo/keto reductase [Desulfatitalea alkaliphila]|uniref:Aldo/keto reductase n=1 Tax=Desulfatitalea alkaliphila TaxID=2929485 RepID=A0AA41R1B9_9BACT|nr:aldo/keto reductase [Desulfatitalea alkaliphila]MCJ8499851.1 aldo/keto reductase [Desulfatitalea alkaliphila]